MKMQKIDPAPLRKAIGAVKKSAADIQAAHEREAAISKEIDEFMETVSAADEQAAKIVGGKRTMLGMMPHIIKKLERLQVEAVAALIAEIDQFEQQIRRAAGSEMEALVGKIAALLRPYCRDDETARGLAVRCDVFANFPTDVILASSIATWDRDQNRAAYDASVITRAQELLAIFEEWQRNGGFARSSLSGA